MGLSLAEKKAVSKQMAKRYARARKGEKSRMLDELCGLTGWTRRHARRALHQGTEPTLSSPRAPRPRTYGPEVVEALRFVWATLNGPTGKRLGPFMAEIVSALERCGELELEAEAQQAPSHLRRHDRSGPCPRTPAPTGSRALRHQAGIHPSSPDPDQDLRGLG